MTHEPTDDYYAPGPLSPAQEVEWEMSRLRQGLQDAQVYYERTGQRHKAETDRRMAYMAATLAGEA